MIARGYVSRKATIGTQKETERRQRMIGVDVGDEGGGTVGGSKETREQGLV